MGSYLKKLSVCSALLTAMNEGPVLAPKLSKRRQSVQKAVGAVHCRVLRKDGYRYLNQRDRDSAERAISKVSTLTADLRSAAVDYWHWPLLDAIDRALAE